MEADYDTDDEHTDQARRAVTDKGLLNWPGLEGPCGRRRHLGPFLEAAGGPTGATSRIICAQGPQTRDS